MRTRGGGRGATPDIGNIFATLRGQATEVPTSDYNENDFAGGMASPSRGRGRGSVRSQILMRNVQRVLEQMENQDNQANAQPQQPDPVRGARSGRGGRGARGAAIQTPSSRKVKGEDGTQADPLPKKSPKNTSPKKKTPTVKTKGEGAITKGKKTLATSTKSGGRGGPAKNLSTKSTKEAAPPAQLGDTQQTTEVRNAPNT